jgi:hypothetical protein
MRQAISGVKFRVDEIDRFFEDISHAYGTSPERLALLSIEPSTLAGAFGFLRLLPSCCSHTEFAAALLLATGHRLITLYIHS